MEKTSGQTAEEAASTVTELPHGISQTAVRFYAVRALSEGRRVSMPIVIGGVPSVFAVELPYSEDWIRDLSPREVRTILKLAPTDPLDTIGEERPPSAAQLGARLYRELLRHARALAAVESGDALVALGRLGLPTVLARPAVVSEIVRRAVAVQLTHAESTGGDPGDVFGEMPARWARIGIAVLHWLADGDEEILALTTKHAQPGEVVAFLRNRPADTLAAALGIDRDGRGFDELVAHVSALRLDLEQREDRASKIVSALDAWLEGRGERLPPAALPFDVVNAVERVVERAAQVWQ
jgi:hypothetical protein